MTGFGDTSYAQGFRDLVVRIARRVVTEERPEPRIGKVFSYDASTKTAQVLFVGETIDSLVKVKVAANMAPQNFMEDQYDILGYDAPADIVRVWGKPGAWFLLDYYSGSPVPGGVIGVPMPWLANTAPERHILLQGQVESRAAWPHLFALWGTTFNTGGETDAFFRVPDGQDKVMMGASGTIPLGSTGGAKARTLLAANLPPHAHTIAHAHERITAGIGGGDLDFDSGGTAGVAPGSAGGVRSAGTNKLATNGSNTASSGNGPGTSAPIDILPPYLAVNWIVRAAP